MRIILYPLAALLLIVAIAFTVSNTQFVEMGIWPMKQTIALPAFAWVLAAMLVGFILGIIAMLFTGQKKRMQLQIQKRQAEQKSRDIEAIKGEVEALVAQRENKAFKAIAK
ncbi:MAG: lipopolysaccharide assembly protein LapA domain-containing protein [Alphaproteobacteria bacterium]